MEYELHKLKEGFIITSDEEIKEEDLIYGLFNGGVLLKSKINVPIHSQYYKEYGLKVITQQDQIDFSALKLEDQKEIGWFDVEKFALDSYNKSYPNYEPVTDYKLVEKYRSVEQFNNGFQKAQELLSDRSFTLEDIERAMIEGLSIEKFWEKCVQSLSQPKSWKVELEMEDKIALDGHTVVGKEPKLTNGKIKILKLL